MKEGLNVFSFWMRKGSCWADRFSCENVSAVKRNRVFIIEESFIVAFFIFENLNVLVALAAKVFVLTLAAKATGTGAIVQL